MQTISLNQEGFDYKTYLLEIANESNFEITYVDIEEKSHSGKYQCLLQLCILPVAVCYGWGKTANDAQVLAAKSALEYVKIIMKQKQ